MAPEIYGRIFKIVNTELMLCIKFLRTFWKIAPRCTRHNTSDIKSTLVHVIACWCQATSHYLSQLWPRSMLPYSFIMPQWVKQMFIFNTRFLQFEWCYVIICFVFRAFTNTLVACHGRIKQQNVILIYVSIDMVNKILTQLITQIEVSHLIFDYYQFSTSCTAIDLNKNIQINSHPATLVVSRFIPTHEMLPTSYLTYSQNYIFDASL